MWYIITALDYRIGNVECRPAERAALGARVACPASFRDVDSRIGPSRRAGIRKGIEKHVHFAAAERAEQAAPNDGQPEEAVDQCDDADWNQERQ